MSLARKGEGVNRRIHVSEAVIGRLAKKYEFLLNGRIDVANPGDEALARRYREHASRYRVRSRESFKSSPFGEDRQDDNLDDNALQSLKWMQ